MDHDEKVNCILKKVKEQFEVNKDEEEEIIKYIIEKMSNK